MRAIFIIEDTNGTKIMEFSSLKKGRMEGWDLYERTFFNNVKEGAILKIPNMTGIGFTSIQFCKPTKVFLQHCFYQATLE